MINGFEIVITVRFFGRRRIFFDPNDGHRFDLVIGCNSTILRGEPLGHVRDEGDVVGVRRNQRVNDAQ